jgi:Restriction alleviation protein Lar
MAKEKPKKPSPQIAGGEQSQLDAALGSAAEDKPRPCPFCGGNKLRYDFCSSQGYIECLDCGAMGPCDEKAADPHCDLNAAWDAWNRRAQTGEPPNAEVSHFHQPEKRERRSPMSCYDCEDCGPDYVCRYCQPMIVAAPSGHAAGENCAPLTGSAATWLWRISVDDGLGGPYDFEVEGTDDASPYGVVEAVASFLKGRITKP